MAPILSRARAQVSRVEEAADGGAFRFTVVGGGLGLGGFAVRCVATACVAAAALVPNERRGKK